ncbi:response regulator [Shouchella clausii]|jgi:response regulator of citrate/malate metabolism|uniref:Two-component response regulator n=2 Tax=Shouchella clausii TaxID=79880 RepID=Q5WKA0_SHOC1|nr:MULTISPECIES: response regulator [Shouchella]MCM3314044.1 response regulator [Psychrobacillus sp. MER TA 17]ALA52185.1 Two-component response regulator [Shouchella clausii]MBU3230374.1 response regulator [Shouchella clausii]MBU3262427.1 response regulator [Shouchella clausii]MBU3507258.1 response regulator [Shouchella clausii]
MQTPSIGVLIVEDDPVAASVYEQLIQSKLDFTIVGKAETAKATKQLLQVITPDLVLLDVQLPDANGIDLLFHIKQLDHHVDVILITASNDAQTVGEAKRGGAFSYMLKPIIVDRFFQTLEEYKAARTKGKPKSTDAERDIQRLFHHDKTGQPASNVGLRTSGPLPKGIDKHTLKNVEEALVHITESESLNAEQVGKRIGTSHSTARRYLEYLVSIGAVKVDVVYGHVGRPERRYKQAARK